ncbi:unnamed protein product [Phytomonas sp. Hart1]|nr:unnamed protein product [Phytomonas sp. Hart1]|eukprot:CCW68487.1 unnamed protein product [Phytomonas sp. isolate Hart1]
MFRFTLQSRLLHVGGSSAGWAPRSVKHAQRHSKQALQLSRQRFHLQKENARIRQSVNYDYVEQRRMQGKSREALSTAAHGLIHSVSKGRNHDASQHFYSPQDRADDMATARHLLLLGEAKRREMKRGRTQRLETFRSLKHR